MLADSIGGRCRIMYVSLVLNPSFVSSLLSTSCPCYRYPHHYNYFILWIDTQTLILLPFILKPNNTSWIKGAERKLAQVRLAEDAGEADKDTLGDS
jgi:hypothetical protein